MNLPYFHVCKSPCLSFFQWFVVCSMSAKGKHHKHFLVIWTLLVKKKQFAIVLALHRSIPLHSRVSYYLNRKAFLKSKEKHFFLTPISMKSSRTSFSQWKKEQDLEFPPSAVCDVLPALFLLCIHIHSSSSTCWCIHKELICPDICDSSQHNSLSRPPLWYLSISQELSTIQIHQPCSGRCCSTSGAILPFPFVKWRRLYLGKLCTGMVCMGKVYISSFFLSVRAFTSL